jgi:formate--tetrahydrofolate ligase
LHFTGDFHAITSANNTLAALVDNYQYLNQGKPTGLKKVLWRRVLDVNDRSLRYITSGLGGSTNGIPQETGFDITPASEIMAILCLSTSLDDLRRRVGQILLGYTHEGIAFRVDDLKVTGAIIALLKDAIHPNLVQTLEGGAAFIHGGPFANIAHGCNSIMATYAALQHSEYTVTESGFGSDLGAEKFLNIKCRAAGLTPKATVLVTTTQSLKLHNRLI